MSKPEIKEDPRAPLFAHMMRDRFGVADPFKEDEHLLRRARDRAEADIRSLDTQGLAYLRIDMNEAVRREQREVEAYDPLAFAKT